MSYQDGMLKPLFRVTGAIGALGKTNLKYLGTMISYFAHCEIERAHCSTGWAVLAPRHRLVQVRGDVEQTHSGVAQTMEEENGCRVHAAWSYGDTAASDVI